MSSENLRITSLDGVRFVAFALVFIHHFEVAPDWLWLWQGINGRGYGGVDLFFALSAFVLFHNLDSTRIKHGKVSLREFFLRRIVRIYPLMIGYCAVVLLVLGGTFGQWMRLSGLTLGLDNIISVTGLGSQLIPYASHLWSLSFELQLYLLLPALYFLHLKIPTRQFIWLLLGIAGYAFLARGTAFALGAQHPLIYIIPIFRPESFLIGMALWVVKPQWDWRLSAFACVLSVAAFCIIVPAWETALANLFAYPALAIACGSFIDVAMRSPLRSVLSWKPITALGERAYGLYVFHVAAFTVVKVSLIRFGMPAGNFTFWIVLLILTLALTIAVSWLSYDLFEQPIRRFVHKRLSRRPAKIEALQQS